MNETSQYGKKLLRKSFLKENAKISNNLTEDEYSVVAYFASLRKKYDSPLAREFFNKVKAMGTIKEYSKIVTLLGSYFPREYAKLDKDYIAYMVKNTNSIWQQVYDDQYNFKEPLIRPDNKDSIIKDIEALATVIATTFIYMGFFFNDREKFDEFGKTTIQKLHSNAFTFTSFIGMIITCLSIVVAAVSKNPTIGLYGMIIFLLSTAFIIVVDIFRHLRVKGASNRGDTIG